MTLEDYRVDISLKQYSSEEIIKFLGKYDIKQIIITQDDLPLEVISEVFNSDNPYFPDYIYHLLFQKVLKKNPIEDVLGTLNGNKHLIAMAYYYHKNPNGNYGLFESQLSEHIFNQPLSTRTLNEAMVVITIKSLLEDSFKGYARHLYRLLNNTTKEILDEPLRYIKDSFIAKFVIANTNIFEGLFKDEK